MTHVMPTNPEAEQSVVAGILRSPAAVHQLGFLREGDFADPMLGAVYGAIRDLSARGRQVDWRVVASLFEGRAERAGSWLQSLSYMAPPETALPSIAASVRDLADRRRLVLHGEEMVAEALAGGRPAAEMAAHWTSAIAGDVGDSDETVQSAATIAERVTQGLKVDLPCSSTGLAELDKSLCGGLYAGKLYGLIARMKAGKTLLLSTIAMNAAERGAKVLYLPLEMGADELVQRLMARRMQVNSLAFLDDRRRASQEFQMAAGTAAVGMADLPLLFQAKPRMALDSIRQTIARGAMRDGVQGVVVDYLQLITGQQRGQSTAGWLDEITQALAEAAKSWGVWILLAAQENQNQNVRGGEGLLNACDMTLRLHRIDPVVGSTTSRAWLEMMVSRYTIRRNVGAEDNPALMLDTRAGPAFVEIEMQQQTDILEER